MNHLIILSGGTGSRMKSNIPKQYIEVLGKPVIFYTLQNFDLSLFENIVIVVADSWRSYVNKILQINFVSKKILYATAGESRQESILNGLQILNNRAKSDDVIVIHDAARACCSEELVKKLIETCQNSDGVMPVLPVKDTVYFSENGVEISGLLNRDKIFSGQAPEAFKYGQYYKINAELSTEELAKIKGSSEIAFKNGMKIALIEGEETNFKITTPVDLERFIEIQEGKMKK